MSILTDIKTEIKTGIIALTVISTFSLGFLSARKMYKKIAPQQVIMVQKAEPQVIQQDHSIILATVPVKIEKIKPTTIIPDQAIIQGTGTITLNPLINPQPETTLLPTSPIKLDLSVIKEKIDKTGNGEERVIVNAPGYNITGSLEVPETRKEIPDYKKQITALYGYDFNTKQKRYGLQYSYKMTGHVSVDAGVIGNIGFVGLSYEF